MEPARYPANNSEELEAVHTLNSLFDAKLVKPDIKTQDKVPNIDGTLEIVDPDQRPIGHFVVQVKKISDGAMRYDCPTSLVEYSKRNSSPFLLICVDTKNKRAFWSHISAWMPEYKPNQKYFSINFRKVIDEIGPDFPYIDLWVGISSDYLRRITNFPELEKKVDDTFGLQKLPTQECEFFQIFIDEVNIQLDAFFPIVKHEFFADTWKLGVSIHESSENAVAYSIFNIPKGKNSPLVIHDPKASNKPVITLDNGEAIEGITSFHLETGQSNEVSIEWAMKEHLDGPKSLATNFVKRYLERLFREHRFHIYGANLSQELLIRFTTDHSHALGLPKMERYSLSDLTYALGVFFPMWYYLALPRADGFMKKNFPDAAKACPILSFEQISSITRRHNLLPESTVREAIASRARILNLPLFSHDYQFRSLIQAIDFLSAKGIETIEKLDKSWSRQGSWVWECYSIDELVHNFKLMLFGASEDYSSFFSGNQFHHIKSKKVSKEIAFIFAAKTNEWHGSSRGPCAETYCVSNEDRRLPLTTFVDLSKASNECYLDGDDLVFDGLKRHCLSHGWSISLFLDDRDRIQKMLYQWLRKDLEDHLGFTLSI